ncbi:MAG: 9-O-acetylesterase [Planctomycetota bacterium]|nr:MAG: 9-O-acetylesterase [Planctomycetota bacterium]
MKRPRIAACWFLTIALVWTSSAVRADVRLPHVFSDHMVLQRDKPIPVWGWDDPGAKVVVQLGDAKAEAKADANGRWSVQLPARAAGGPLELTVKGTTEAVFDDVLVGEVWLCSGQSNMEWPVSRAMNAQQEIAAANYPRIRHIKIPHRPADKPQDDVPSDGWQVCSPKTVGAFTAVGYFFARHLHKELDGVPIGLIGSNWGGTRIEPWTPPEGFKQVPALKNIADRLDQFPEKRGDRIVHQSPLALYYGMIHPLIPYGIRGALWYQGESNNGEGMLYHEKMKALIYGWRTVWNMPEMPFYFVQLAPFRYRGNPLALPGIWEAQLATLRKVPHTGMVVTVDIATVNNIHPPNKQEVGRRLALWALAKTYGRKGIVYSGPLYREHKREGHAIRIFFDHVGSGLVSRDGKPLTHFQIAGADKTFHDAKAEIDGETVVVSSPEVPEPVAVRFAWHQEAQPNLSNKEGLPASPFRTDSW